MMQLCLRLFSSLVKNVSTDQTLQRPFYHGFKVRSYWQGDMVAQVHELFRVRDIGWIALQRGCCSGLHST